MRERLCKPKLVDHLQQHNSSAQPQQKTNGMRIPNIMDKNKTLISRRRDEGDFHFDRFLQYKMEWHTLGRNPHTFTGCLTRQSEPHEINLFGGKPKRFCRRHARAAPRRTLASQASCARGRGGSRRSPSPTRMP